MSNAVNWDVDEAVYWILRRTVDVAVNRSVAGAIYDAVNRDESRDVNRAVTGAVIWAVGGAAHEDPAHPVLQDFLLESEAL